MFPLGWGWGTGSPLPPGDKDSKDRDTQPVWGRLCPALPSLPPKARVECHRGIGDIVTVWGHCHCPRRGDVSLCRMCCCWVHGEGGGAGSLPWCRSWGVPGGSQGSAPAAAPPTSRALPPRTRPGHPRAGHWSRTRRVRSGPAAPGAVLGPPPGLTPTPHPHGHLQLSLASPMSPQPLLTAPIPPKHPNVPPTP